MTSPLRSAICSQCWCCEIARPCSYIRAVPCKALWAPDIAAAMDHICFICSTGLNNFCHRKSLQISCMLQVVELAQEMTPGMVTIYDAIVDLMDACIKELKRANKIDTSDMTLEECLFRSFDDMIRRQLDPIWHTVTPKTKQVNSH